MAFRLLKRMEPAADKPSVAFASQTEYPSRGEALVAARILCEGQQTTIILVEDLAEISMAPMVKELVPSAPPPPAIVYRGGEHEPIDDVKREPKARPRLLVVKGKPTGADVMKYREYQMVVAEGKIIKNAFGGLELEDMPLKPEELAEVSSALVQA